MSENKPKLNFWTGLISGFVVSILTSIIAIWVQHSYTIQEKTVQLYLDEKKEFAGACDDFLKQYRTWHELMNYFVHNDSGDVQVLSEFENKEQAIKMYRQWKKDIDFAYGKVFILSDNEFGFRTMEVSTVLHGSLAEIISGSKSEEEKEKLLITIDDYFFGNWLLKAQEEIFRFNSGTRKQKSVMQFLEEQQSEIDQRKSSDSLSSELYEQLLRSYKYMQQQDSINGRKSKKRMLTKEEFVEIINSHAETEAH